MNLQRLFRYVKINPWLENVLLKNELYYSNPYDFNDLLDCRFFDVDFTTTPDDLIRNREYVLSEVPVGILKKYPDIRIIYEKEGYKAAAIEMVNRGYYPRSRSKEENLKAKEKIQKEFIGPKFGVSCFSALENDDYMFWHYSDNHKGCCLEFYFPKRTARPIVYTDEAPIIGLDTDKDLLIQKMILTKRLRWKAENEWRMIRYPEGAGIKNFHEAQLASITLAPNTPKESVTLVKSLLNKRNVKIPLFKSVLGLNKMETTREPY